MYIPILRHMLQVDFCLSGYVASIYIGTSDLAQHSSCLSSSDILSSVYTNVHRVMMYIHVQCIYNVYTYTIGLRQICFNSEESCFRSVAFVLCIACSVYTDLTVSTGSVYYIQT